METPPRKRKRAPPDKLGSPVSCQEGSDGSTIHSLDLQHVTASEMADALHIAEGDEEVHKTATAAQAEVSDNLWRVSRKIWGIVRPIYVNSVAASGVVIAVVANKYYELLGKAESKKRMQLGEEVLSRLETFKDTMSTPLLLEDANTKVAIKGAIMATAPSEGTGLREACQRALGLSRTVLDMTLSFPTLPSRMERREI